MDEHGEPPRSDVGCVWAAIVIALCIVGIAFAVLCYLTAPGNADPQPAPPQHTACKTRAAAMAEVWSQWQEKPVLAAPSGPSGGIVVTMSYQKTWTLFRCERDMCCAMAGGAGAMHLKGA